MLDRQSKDDTLPIPISLIIFMVVEKFGPLKKSWNDEQLIIHRLELDNLKHLFGVAVL